MLEVEQELREILEFFVGEDTTVQRYVGSGVRAEAEHPDDRKATP